MKEAREKMTVVIDQRVRAALRRRATELDVGEAAVARNILSEWARQQPAKEAA
jgi:hypothetical protein